MYYVLRDMPPTSSRPDFTSFADLPAFFSTAVFALEGIGVIMPLENNMQDPMNFTGCFRVLNTAMCVVVTLYCVVGYFGYLKFGDKTSGSISLNLPNGEPLSQASKLMVAIAVMCSYPLQMFVPVLLTWPTLSRKLGVSDKVWRGPIQPEHILRLAFVLFTGCVALGIPNLNSLMGLIGAVCLSTAGIIIPAIIETVYRYDKLGKFYWILWKNLGIIIFGVVGMATGVWTNIWSLDH
ncbi:proton-coupled amino acid transporter-like protein pathetic [Hetaerina americana]|uniref:proton-coupled amino acid transporter-like protein pathetic n=1 Tax=Hetaerina americana TaxID=62018 RepID=UPI003A7F4365